jgi:RNA 3'-terminal phosphate cyclase (ATP)
MFHIDGSSGEGGGQILRSSLGLSMVTGIPFRIENIRANREKPGLMRQHLTAVRAAAGLCDAEIRGAELGSRELTFRPGRVKADDYEFDTGSAGSTTLVLQTILPALLMLSEPSTVTLEGGTHNPYAPPLDFMTRSFLPIVNRLGPSITISPDRYGFYPAGGGRFHVMIEPPEKWSQIDLRERGHTLHRRCEALVAGLSPTIAQRELAVMRAGTGWDDDAYVVRELPDDQGPGNVILVEVAHEHVTNVFTGFGIKNRRAEDIADELLEEVTKFLAADVPVGEYLADQLLIPFALAGGGSFITSALSLHTTTNMEVVQRFLNVKIEAMESKPGHWEIAISPR